MVQQHADGELVFALDIGTRTLIGMVGRFEDGRFHVLAQRMLEHESRAMFDGQVHDIPQVARSVARIKAELEEDLDTVLDRAAIAAAGRSLRTVRVSLEQTVDTNTMIDEHLVRAIEYAALQEANSRLGGADGGEVYHCVGHCVVSYALDGLTLTSLVGHRGQVAAVDLIATYLPDSVVTGLLSVLERAGLRPENLTLEPIAAIDAVIPEGMRLLNLALVDIGAGTSDIAITREGSVVAYGMVPVAGDEITEAVAQQCLVDFYTAERLKREMALGGEQRFTDVLGKPVVKSAAEMLEVVGPVLDRLADEVALSILELNEGEAPKAVFCIGGGAQVPTLTDRLADRLGIPRERAAVRDRRALHRVVLPDQDLVPGPDGITVVGIATTARRQPGLVFVRVSVNGQDYRVFNARDLNVAYVLSFIGYDVSRLVGRHGRDLRFTLNGRDEVRLGELFKSGEIYLNDQPANLRSPVTDGDRLTVVDAVDGRNASAVVRDYAETVGGVYVLNGEKRFLPLICTINDRPVELDEPISNGDRVVIRSRSCRVRELMAEAGLSDQELMIRVNGETADPDRLIRNGDVVEFDASPAGNGLNGHHAIRVTVNGREVILAGHEEPVFVDVFNHIELDPSQITGGVKVRINGRDARYTDPLRDGDDIEIVWHDREEQAD